jgi:Helix-turn-helix.
MMLLFADKIRQLREDNNLVQCQLADFLEIDASMYCKIERGSRQIKRTQVIDLAKFFSVDETELLIFWLEKQNWLEKY